MTEEKKVIRFDESPEVWYIHTMDEKFRESEAFKVVPMDAWAKDKSHDFYLGMFQAIGIAMQGCEAAIYNQAPVESIMSELNLLRGQLSTIVKEKESKIILL